MNAVLAVILIVVAVIVGAAVGIFIGNAYRKKVAEAEIGSAEEEAKRIVSDAMKTALRVRMRFIAFATRVKRSSPTAARRYSARSAVSSRRKRPWTVRSTTSRKRKTESTRRSKTPR